MNTQINHLLYRFRWPLVITVLAFILYCNVFMWFYVPPDDFEFAWIPDNQLRVLSVSEEATSAPYLEAGDEILAIGNRPVRRMALLYSLPLQQVYEFSVRREGSVLQYQIPMPAGLTQLAVKNQLPTTLLSLAGWLMSALILIFARRENSQAVHTGFLFLLASIVLVSIQAAQDGTPGAWIGGHPLVFLLAVAWPYLGLIPRDTLLPPPIRRLFMGMLGGALLLAGTALIEGLFLFPQGQSFETLFGISLYSIGFAVSGLGMLSFVLILLGRVFMLPSRSYVRQQLVILLVFVAMGVVPILFFTILPGIMWGRVWLPFPITISLMLFIPVGYLFVIYRRGFLGLDLFFSRFIYLFLLSLIGFSLYAAGLYLVQLLLNLEGMGAVAPATIVFFPTLLLVNYLTPPVQTFAQNLIYGELTLDQEMVVSFSRSLSARPEISTLRQLMKDLSERLSISRAALMLKDEEGEFRIVARVGEQDVELIESIGTFQRPLLRAATDETEDALFVLFPWAEVLIPLWVRDEQIGVMALSRPGDGYFNARQVSFLEQTASGLAVASENIYLFEAVRHLSRRTLAIREEERRQLSLRIHDAPLQEITYVTNVIDHLLVKAANGVSLNGSTVVNKAESDLAKAVGHLRSAASTLREICIGLYPPFREQGVHLAIEEIAWQFREQYEIQVSIKSEGCQKLRNMVTFERFEQITTAASHVLTEALNNIVKYAATAQVIVTLHCNGEKMVLIVADDGPGSPVPLLSFSELVRRQHLGVVGMHEWARYAGGRLHVIRNHPAGMKITLECPL